MDGRPFIVSEFVEGETVRQRLARGTLPLREAIDIGVQVAGALAAAHARDIVHRDIKPENVMVRPDGYVKVLDFGLAKLVPAEGRPTPMPHTQPGGVLGTPRYMSPEQIRGLDVDARTDVWSLGVVLHEMVAGRPPFDGATMADITAAVLRSDPVPVDVHAPQAPAALGRLVSRALTKDRALRFASAGEMLAELVALKSSMDSAADRERTGGSHVATKKPRSRRAVAIDSLAVVPFVNGSGDADADYFCDASPRRSSRASRRCRSCG